MPPPKTLSLSTFVKWSVSSGVKTGGGQEKQKLLTDLEDKWNRADKRAEHYELKYQQALKTLTAVRAGLQSIYNRYFRFITWLSSLHIRSSFFIILVLIQSDFNTLTLKADIVILAGAEAEL